MEEKSTWENKFDSDTQQIRPVSFIEIVGFCSSINQIYLCERYK